MSVSFHSGSGRISIDGIMDYFLRRFVVVRIRGDEVSLVVHGLGLDMDM